MIGWAIFYGIATFAAVGLSLKRGGPISVVGSMVGVAWIFQGWLYLIAPAEVGDMVGSALNVALILAVISLSRATIWGGVVVSSLLCQLFLTYASSITGAHSDVARNVLYIIQLIALGWSGGKLVLDSLGRYVASLWRRGGSSLASQWSKEACRRYVSGGRYRAAVRNGGGSSV